MQFLKILFLFLFLGNTLYATKKDIDFSMVISGGVSLGAYEAGYNWAIIKMLTTMKKRSKVVNPNLKSVTGASAGSINALLTTMYWCQKDSIPLHNSINDNLFYETWVNLGIEDLMIVGENVDNKSSLLTRKGLEKKGKKIIKQLKQPIFRKGCEVPLGIAITKVSPMIETINGITVKNQNFSVPLIFKEYKNKGMIVNKKLPSDGNFYLSIPGIEKNYQKAINLLFASSAFPGAFQQVNLDYLYKGKKESGYFIDGGLYDNVPLDLAITLNKKITTFFFINPHNMRKEDIEKQNTTKKETIPLGFIETNLSPVFKSFDIMQSVKLYDAIKKHFSKKTNKKLILSSRYHPLTGNFLGHFGAFLDYNFRIYDYYVGVYDAIYHIASAFKKIYPPTVNNKNQVARMNFLKNILGIDKNPEALSAYTLFLNTEFHHLSPKTTNRFSSIYNAFNLKKSDKNRYDTNDFKSFLTQLNMKYLTFSKKGFLANTHKNINNWYKKPLKNIVTRISTMENDKAKVYSENKSMSRLVATGAWAGSTFLKEKKGFNFLPMDVPKDKNKESFRKALNFLPNDISTDINNGGLSLGYFSSYYTDSNYISGLEAKASYVLADDTSNFVRFDMDMFNEQDDFVKFGVGVSAFGDMDGKFYKKDSAYGANAFVDIMEIFRLTYVHRKGRDNTKNYLYFSIENIPSLIYWLNR